MKVNALVFKLTAIPGIGELRGCGRPTITVWGNILACLIVGYPIGLTLVFVFNFGLAGVRMLLLLFFFYLSNADQVSSGLARNE